VSRQTIARAVEIAGTGLHTGAEVTLRLEPGLAGQGIVFQRLDLGPGRPIAARLERVAATDRRTALRSGSHRADTVEHLLAALYALGIDDLAVILSGPEVPILDGSFAPWVTLLDQAGHRKQPGGVRRACVSSMLRVTEGEALYRIEPADGFDVRVTLEFVEPVIGRQSVGLRLAPGVFREEIQSARTFGFLREVDELRVRGLLGGAAPDCAIVLDEVSVLNTTLRWPNEFARHKVGDLIGDLALIGARLSLRVDAFRPSHRGNIACARAIAQAARFTEEG
jgi:UDP-3-O-acyl N-acetylglucosamine deacetylase